MFEAKAAMFLYSVSPVHMGAGTALGAIDNPIQRERHTQHPVLAGSGLKGAMRHEARHRWKGENLTDVIFGPEPTGRDDERSAGALSLSDAQLVLFPVRSLRGSYVYATCPTALARARRLLTLAGVPDLEQWLVPESLGEDQALLCNSDLLAGEQLILETFAFSRAVGDVKPLAKSLARLALTDAPASDYFARKVENDMVVLNDTRYSYFVRNATLVEPHVHIDDATGTARKGGLFYTENVPPESLFVSLVMANKARRSDDALPAAQVLKKVIGAYDKQMIQVGGDSTTGRGQMLLRFEGGTA